MSVLLDTDLLSLLERKRVPAKLAAWLEENDDALFVTLAILANAASGLPGEAQGFHEGFGWDILVAALRAGKRNCESG